MEKKLFEIILTDSIGNIDSVKCSIETEKFNLIAACIIKEMKRHPQFEVSMLNALNDYQNGKRTNC